VAVDAVVLPLKFPLLMSTVASRIISLPATLSYITFLNLILKSFCTLYEEITVKLATVEPLSYSTSKSKSISCGGVGVGVGVTEFVGDNDGVNVGVEVIEGVGDGEVNLLPEDKQEVQLSNMLLGDGIVK